MRFIAGFAVAALVLSTGATSVSASGRDRRLHATKECSEYHGNAGEWCTISSSNVRSLPVGTKIFYTQPIGIPTGMLDSNVVLDAGNGNRAFGRCTTDLVTWIGLCTLSDGVGTLAGFHARLDVSLKSLDFGTFNLRGTYHFTRRGSK